MVSHITAIALLLSAAAAQVTTEPDGSTTFKAPKPMEQSTSVSAVLPSSVTDITEISGSPSTKSTKNSISISSTLPSSVTDITMITGTSPLPTSTTSKTASGSTASATQTPGNGAANLAAPGSYSLMLAGLGLGAVLIH